MKYSIQLRTITVGARLRTCASWHLRLRRTCLRAALALPVALSIGPSPVRAGVTEAWVHRYGNVVGNATDTAFKIVRDAAGDFIVAGISDGIGGAGIEIIKYSGASGSVVWQQRYYGTADPGFGRLGLVVDGSGNAAVTGTSYHAENADYYTAKYAAADGALLWEKRYNGPADSDDFAYAVAMDSSGNVVVTGTSDNGSNEDYYTAGYAAADGALLWEKRYNGPANGDDYVNGPHSLAAGPNGIMVITGSSDGNFTADTTATFDFATVLYRRIPPPASYSAWASSFGLSGAAAAPDADPDKDGLPNAAEYILGGNPAVAGASGRPTATSSGGNMLFSFLRDDASKTPDVTLTVESGTDLVTWPAVFNIGPNTSSSSPGVSIIENGAAPDTISVAISTTTDEAKFARLKVTINP